MGRRGALLALIGLCAGVLAPRSDGGSAASPVYQLLGEWLHRCGASLFPDLAALRQLGADYLADHPEENSRTLLAQLLIGGEEGPVRSRIAKSIARDWSVHHVTVVDGWLLARTEARFCAALYLEECART